jgi:hypothetical protein
LGKEKVVKKTATALVMQFWLEESTLAEEFWPLKGAS